MAFTSTNQVPFASLWQFVSAQECPEKMFPDFQVSLFLTLQSAQTQMEAVCHFSQFKLFLSVLKYLSITDHLIKINENT
jgi:hypothetical protein